MGMTVYCSATSDPTERELVYMYINIPINLRLFFWGEVGGFDKKLPHVNTTVQEPTLYPAYRC